MKTTQFRRALSLILCIALVAAVALFCIGCGRSNDDGGEVTEATGNGGQIDGGEVGQGSKSFAFVVVDLDGNETKFTVKTDKTTVGAALLENKLIEGDDGQYGLYVKTVNGITADYDKDGTYWAFYVDGKYAMSGVDSTEIKEGETYSFVVSK